VGWRNKGRDRCVNVIEKLCFSMNSRSRESDELGEKLRRMIIFGKEE
jgi:hypothetical protein